MRGAGPVVGWLGSVLGLLLAGAAFLIFLSKHFLLFFSPFSKLILKLVQTFLEKLQKYFSGSLSNIGYYGISLAIN